MNNQAIYQKLLEPQHFDQLQQQMKAQHVFESLNVTAVAAGEQDGFPYILLTIKTEQLFAAQMVGLNLFIDSIVAEHSDPYYFPVITMAEGYDVKFSSRINQQNSIKHELIHVKDILALTDSDPTYLPRIRQYSLNKLADAKDLSKSIAIEVFKIFYLEPQAFASDFNLGEKTIRTQFMGQLLEYDCHTEQEYIEMQLSDYLGNLSAAYLSKFPHEKKRIEKKINASVMKYGQKTLGADPLASLAKIKQDYPTKILSGMLNTMSIKSVKSVKP